MKKSSFKVTRQEINIYRVQEHFKEIKHSNTNKSKKFSQNQILKIKISSILMEIVISIYITDWETNVLINLHCRSI